ncbi:MAG: hypothetical protein ACOYXT_09545 [Bacteroidota bacterium]
MSQPATPPKITAEGKRHPSSQNESRWRKLLRILGYFVLSSIVLTLLEIGVGYWLLSSRWEIHVPEDKMEVFAKDILAAEPLPENFRAVYTALFPRHVNATMSEQVFLNYGARILFRNQHIDARPHCFCDLVYDLQLKKNKGLASIPWPGRLQDLEYGFGMERFAPPNKCFDYVIRERVAGLQKVLDSKRFGHVINKRLEDMNDDEIVELILLIKSKNQFNRYKNPSMFAKAFEYYKGKLAEARANGKT